MYFEISKWEMKPLLMSVEYKTKDRMEFIKNLMALITLIELEQNIKIDRENMFEYIHIHEIESNLTNNQLLDYLEEESLKVLDNL